MNNHMEVMIRNIYQLDRSRCIHELRHFERLPLDFTEDFLNKLSVDRLRHILLAALLQARKN